MTICTVNFGPIFLRLPKVLPGHTRILGTSLTRATFWVAVPPKPEWNVLQSRNPTFLPPRKTATACTTAVTCWQCQLHPAVKLNKPPMVLKCLARNDKASKGTENTSQTQALHTTTTKLQVLPAHLQYRISLSHYRIVIIITIIVIMTPYL